MKFKVLSRRKFGDITSIVAVFGVLSLKCVLKHFKKVPSLTNT